MASYDFLLCPPKGSKSKQQIYERQVRGAKGRGRGVPGLAIGLLDFPLLSHFKMVAQDVFMCFFNFPSSPPAQGIRFLQNERGLILRQTGHQIGSGTFIRAFNSASAEVSRSVDHSSFSHPSGTQNIT